MVTSIRSKRKRVVLFNMPWGYVLEPSLGLGILKTLLCQQGIECKVVECPPRLLRWVKYPTYHEISTTWVLNDFCFTHEFEPQITDEQMEQVERICRDDLDLLRNYPRTVRSAGELIEKVLRLRNEIVPAFLDDLLDEEVDEDLSMVGFTNLFDQTWASLALARKIKRRYPHLPIAFGGASIEKPVGNKLQEIMPEMDAVAYGDGEPVIIPLLEAFCGERPIEEVPNISYRDEGGSVRFSHQQGVRAQLEKSPVPNFDDYFLLRDEMKEKHQVVYPVGEMPFESSRGCWWGQKHHCVFCGIDQFAMQYRRKPAEVVKSQLDSLHRRYGMKTFRFNDYIMPISNFKKFLNMMIEEGAPYHLHYEIKANLTKEQLDQAAAAGIYYLQPGIESFSTPVLKRMNKGVKGIQNVFTLFHMMANGIYCYYNLLFGFPGDQPEDYRDMIKLIPCLYHLIPPGCVTYPMVVRYSPMQTHPERFGAKSEDVKPHWRYDVMFSDEFVKKNKVELQDYVYYFESPPEYRAFDDEMKTLFEVLQHQAIFWEAKFKNDPAKLSYEVVDDRLVVRDTRFSSKFGRAEAKLLEFGPDHAKIYEVLSTKICGHQQLLKSLNGSGISEEIVPKVLGDLCDARVIIEDGSLYTGIAFHEDVYKSGRDWWYHEDVKNTFKNRCRPTSEFEPMPEFELADSPSQPSVPSPELVPLASK